MRKYKLLIIYGFLFLTAIYFVNGGGACVPNNYCYQFVESVKTQCERNYGEFYVDASWQWKIPEYGFGIECEDILKYKIECVMGGYPYLATDYWTSPIPGEPGAVYFYADIDNIVYCPAGCEGINGNARCKPDENSKVPYEPECSEGYMKCQNNNVYECKNNDWKVKEYCSNFQCEHAQWDYAYCKTNIYYCKIANSKCFTNSHKLENCYDTYEECQNSFEVWCGNTVDKKCYKKSSCGKDELEYTGDNLDLAYTSCVESFWECKTNFNCPVNFECSKEHLCFSPDNMGENIIVQEPTKFDNIMSGFKSGISGIWGGVSIAVIFLAIVLSVIYVPRIIPMATPYVYIIAFLAFLIFIITTGDFSLIGWLLG